MSPSSPTGGPPLRAVAMVLIAFAIVFGGLGAFSLQSSNSSSSSSSGASATGSATASSSAKPAAVPSASSVSTPAAAAPQSPPAAEAPATPPSATAETAPDGSGAVDKSAPVRVLNNSMVHGLAATVANRLRSDGWSNLSTGNYPASDAQLAQTTVYYGDAPGEQAAAQAIAAELGATALPKSKGVALPTSGVVVIVTSG